MKNTKFNFAKAIEEVAKESKLDVEAIEKELSSSKIKFGKSLKWYPADKVKEIPASLTLAPVSLHERKLDNGDVYFTLKCKNETLDADKNLIGDNFYSVPASWIFNTKGKEVEALQFSNLTVSPEEYPEWAKRKAMVQAKYDLA